jgi:hypothetical protein
MELTGVVLPAPDEASLKEMAVCIVEEFSRLGMGEERIRAIFRNPFYRGPHGVWKEKGEAFVESVIQEVCLAWGRPASSGDDPRTR